MTAQDIGDILVASGIITESQVVDFRQKSNAQGRQLAEFLVEQKIISNEQAAQALAKLTSYTYISKITEDMADPKLLGKIPLKFLRQNCVIPVLIDNKITLISANPLQFQPLDELIAIFDIESNIVVSTPQAITDAINRFYPIEGTKQMIEELEEEKNELQEVEFGDMQDKDILSMATEAPIIKLVNHILVQAVKRGSSDIHIEPFEKELSVRYRIDGIMQTVMNPPKRVQGALTSRIKIMANLNIAEKRIPQDGRIEIRVAEKAFDIRVSILPVVFGERIVMRLLDKTKTFTGLKDLGLSERDYGIVQQAIARPNGIFFVTGPTGSGKTTTLYSVLNQLNEPDVNIITVEDPVEYQIAGIGQVQVYSKVGLTFASALRSILRQDPDIVMIGEIRDQETAQIAIQAALTGHLVLSTLHTNNAPSAITRLIDMGIEPFLIASSVVAIAAQRLVRSLCQACKKKYTPTQEKLASVGITPGQAAGIIFYEPAGCSDCNMTGYKGRLAIFELMAITADIAKLTVDRADASLLRKQAQKDGMTLLIQDGARKIIQGLTTIEEVVRVAAADEEIM